MCVHLRNTGQLDVRLAAYLESGLHQWEHQVWCNEGHLGEGRARSHSQGVVLQQHTGIQLSQHNVIFQINCSLAIKTQMQADQML